MSEEFVMGTWYCFFVLAVSLIFITLLNVIMSFLRFRDYKRCKKFIRIYEFENNPLNDDDWNGK